MKKTTDFGFKKVDVDIKSNLVKDIFDSVSYKYDLMNDVMSVGLHRLWKKTAISLSGIDENSYILDLAGGTGDLTILLRKKISKRGKIILSDINYLMLELAYSKLLDNGISDVDIMQLDAEKIPFSDNTFNCVTIAFGLRNITNKQLALSEMYRVLKSGGRLIILEFSKVNKPYLNELYQFYLFNIIPNFGKYIAKDRDSYKYLAESISNFYNQEQLQKIILDVGFDYCQYYNLSQGIVAIHKGIKK